MEETEIQPAAPKTALKVDVEGLPLLLGLGGFKPTVFQAQAVYLFLSQTDNQPIHRIVGEITYDASLWYKWKKRAGFMEWFDKVCHSTFSSDKLLDVHAAVYRRAMGNSPADAKLFLQRFDKNYTERSQSDQRHSFQGYDPPAADESRERQRKALAKQAPGTYADDQMLLPVVHTPTEPDTGVVPASTTPTPPHTQSQSAEHVVGMDAALSNDNTLDSEPITKVDPPGPGLSR